MITHRFHVRPEIFQKILEGKKTIESRLYDEKRKAIKIGDTLVFYTDGGAELSAEVIELLVDKTFEELFSTHSPDLFGNPSKEFSLQEISQFYSEEDQNKYGVLGIRFEVMGSK